MDGRRAGSKEAGTSGVGVFEDLLRQLRAEYARATGLPPPPPPSPTRACLLKRPVPDAPCGSPPSLLDVADRSSDGPSKASREDRETAAGEEQPLPGEVISPKPSPKRTSLRVLPSLSEIEEGGDSEKSIGGIEKSIGAKTRPACSDEAADARPHMMRRHSSPNVLLGDIGKSLSLLDSSTSVKDGATGADGLGQAQEVEDFVLRKAWARSAPSGRLSQRAQSVARLPTDYQSNDEIQVLSYDGHMRHLIGFPGSPARVSWDMAGALLIFYDLFVIPLGAFDLGDSVVLAVMDWVTLVFWTLNIGGSLTVGFVRQGVTVMVPKLIALNYFRSWFIIDCMVVVPDWVFTLAAATATTDTSDEQQSTSENTGSSVKLLRILRLVRMTRLLRLLKLRKVMDSVNDHIDSEYLSIVANIAKMITLLLVINHVIACVWWMVGGSGSDAAAASWINAHEFADARWGYQYATSFHWSITQFTPSSMSVQPQNLLERTFAITVVVFALVGFSYVVGSITGSLTQLRSMQEETSKQFWNLRKYLKQHQVPVELKMRIQRYLEHAWAQKDEKQNVRSVKIFNLLSDQLMSELQCELSEKHLCIHPLLNQLKEISAVSMQRIANTAITRKQLARKDQLFHASEQAHNMYIVIDGRLRYARKFASDPDADDKVEKVDSGEDWIGEPVLWLETWIHRGQLEAEIECDLVLLNPDKFGEVMRQNPDAHLLASTYARNFLIWMKGEDPDDISDIFQGREGEKNNGLSKSFFAELHEHLDFSKQANAGGAGGGTSNGAGSAAGAGSLLKRTLTASFSSAGTGFGSLNRVGSFGPSSSDKGIARQASR